MRYLISILQCGIGFVNKCHEVLRTLYGWVCVVAFSFLNFFAGYSTAITAVVVCVALDTAWGIAAQVKQGHFALSELGRKGMLSKILLYASTLIAFIHIERVVGLESHLPVEIISALICVVEVWSMSGSALIVNPEMPFLRLFRKILKGEIARKMAIKEEDLDELMKDRKNGKSENTPTP